MELNLVQITQAENKGSLMFVGALDPQTKQPDVVAAISFNKPEQTNYFVFGKKYKISITEIKD